MMMESIELKSKQEQLQTWIEEERNHNEILQSEIQKKVQEGFEIEEERVSVDSRYDIECITGCNQGNSEGTARLKGGVFSASGEV